MRTKSIVTIGLAGALAALSLSLSPALAAKHRPKATGACAQSAGRCVSDCDQLDWCTMYACINDRSTPISFWRCYEPSGLCVAPHC